MFELSIAEDVFLDGFKLLRRGFRRKGQQEVEVADSLFRAAQRTCRRDRADWLAITLNVSDELGGFVLGGGDEEAAGNLFENLDGFEDVLFGLFAEAGKGPELAFAGKLLELLDGATFEFAPKKQSLLGAERLQREHFEHGQRIFLEQLFAQPVIAGG